MTLKTSNKKAHTNLLLKKMPRQLWFWRHWQQKLGKWWWWILTFRRLSSLPFAGRFFDSLAGLPLGHYVNKRPLAEIKTYISPKAQVDCPDLHLGRKCFIDDFVTISGRDGRVELGKRTHIHRGTIIEVDQGGQVIIGDHTFVFSNCNLNGCLGNVLIGSRVMIAAHCGFTPYQHKLDDLSRPMAAQELTSKGDIVIEDDVWLGMGVKVMDGVRIGQGAVVGANAVVTKDIPPFSVAVGVPARVIHKREHRAQEKVKQCKTPLQ